MPCPYRDVSRRALEAAEIRRDGGSAWEEKVTWTGIPAYIQGNRPAACPCWKAEKDDRRSKPTTR
jgi:hypothetical protein